MKRGGTIGSAMGAIVLAVLMLRAPTAGPGPSTEQSASPPRPTKAQSSADANRQPQQPVQAGPWLAAQQHFAGVPGQEQCGVAQDALGRWCIPASGTVRALIAIAPDPVHTHMSLVFDRSLEAIRLAAESVSYVEDRYWLPWSAQQPAADEAERLKQPGLLLFRWNGDNADSSPKLLYVFLVSDTATSGINGSQFSNAVEYVREITCNSVSTTCAEAATLHIMGPTFSGSLASLKGLTDNQSQQFVVYSGTVSSGDAIEKARLGPNVTVKSFVSDTQLSIQTLLSSLERDHNIECPTSDKQRVREVAILAEASTSYGAAQQKNSYENAKMEPSNVAQQKGAPPAESPGCYDSFSYPREIASLRNAYLKAGSANASQSKTTLSQGYLPFNLAEQPANASDQPPSFSTEQGPVSDEAVLMDMANQLRRGQYRYIGVIGSNVLDVLFLTRFLRNACPNARIFVTNADLLFERELDNAPYIGTLALTTYPMFGRNLDWAGARWSRRPFADQYEEGQYNAMFATLAEALGKPLSLAETKSPANYKSSHPLWLTTVGSGGYWPVKLLSEDSLFTSDQNGWKPTLREADFAAGWRILLALVSGVALLHICLLITASPAARRFRDFSLLGGALAQRLLFIHLASASLALALLILISPAWEFGVHEGKYLFTMEMLVPAIIVLLLLACLVLQLNQFLRRKWELKTGQVIAEREFRRAATGALIGGIGVWGIAILLAIFWNRQFIHDPSHYGFFFAYRCLNLATGVSPITPMLPLLATIYTWCIFELWRLRFNDSARPRISPCKDGAEKTSAYRLPGVAGEEKLARAIGGFFLDYKYVVAVGLLFFLWLLFLDPVHPFELFEKRSFGIIYEVLFAGVVLLNLSSGFRLGQVWSELRIILWELERSPIREAFNRLKGFGWSPIWRQGGEEVDWIYMARSLEALSHVTHAQSELKVEDAALDAETLSAIGQLRSQAGELRNCVEGLKQSSAGAVALRNLRDYFRAGSSKAGLSGSASGEPDGRCIVQASRFTTAFHQFQCNLARVQQGIWNVLARRWSTGDFKPVNGGSEKDDKSHDSGDEPNAKDLQLRQMEEFVALRYVNFIRAVMGHMRHLLWILAISFTLMLTSLNLYSFEPHQTLIWSFTAIFFVVGITIILVLMQVHRDPVLSRITDSKPDELGFEFYMRIVSVGVIPLLTLLATHFPSIARSLLGFLQPSLEALK